MEGNLTKEIINEYREYLYQLSSDGEHPRMVDAICDMALKALSAPAPLSSEAVGQLKEIARQARIVYRETSAEGYIQNTTGATELDVLDEMLKEYEALSAPPTLSGEKDKK